MLLQYSAGLHVHVSGEGADGDVVASITDVAEVADATDVDQNAGRRQAQFHQRQQAVPTGKELRVLTVLTNEADGLFCRTGTDVVECCGNHLLSPFEGIFGIAA